MPDAKTTSKLFYRLDEVSRLTKVDAVTIESWEKEFPFLQPGLTGAGQKIFRAKDVEIIQRIKALLDGKSVTLAGAKRRIEEELGLRSATPVHPDRLKKTLLQVRDELASLVQELSAGPKKR
ncbi:MAG: MerR family transcriptional regulator [Candidatus Aminicenantales bacterium]|jgi:DNA-binding transcriptional MerR regulator